MDAEKGTPIWPLLKILWKKFWLSAWNFTTSKGKGRKVKKVAIALFQFLFTEETIKAISVMLEQLDEKHDNDYVLSSGELYKMFIFNGIREEIGCNCGAEKIAKLLTTVDHGETFQNKKIDALG